MTKMREVVVIGCPFCSFLSIQAVHKNSYVSHRIEHISNKRSVVCFRVPEGWDVLSGCDKCGRNLKEVCANFEGKDTRTHEERLARLKLRGLPLKVEF